MAERVLVAGTSAFNAAEKTKTKFKSLGSLAARLLRSRGFEVEKMRVGEGMVVRWARQDEPTPASDEAKPC